MKPLIASQRTRHKFATKHFQIGIIQELTSPKNSELFFRGAQAMCELGFIVSVLAIGDQSSQEKCFELSQKYTDQFEILEATSQNKQKVINQSHIICFTHIPEKTTLKNIMKKSIIPMLPYGNLELTNFDAQKESGNAFLYEENNFWEFFATLIRAFENFKFNYDWNNLKKTVKKSGDEL